LSCTRCPAKVSLLEQWQNPAAMMLRRRAHSSSGRCIAFHAGRCPSNGCIIANFFHFGYQQEE
jgi:hypothetical protein